MRAQRLACLLILAGCADPAPSDTAAGTGPLQLLNPAALRPVPAEDDPLAAHRPGSVTCPSAAYGPEGAGFEIQTGVCDYASFWQPLGVSLVPGDTLTVTVWHDTLDAPEPATGHAAVWLDGVVLWEAETEIPAASGAWQGEVLIEEPVSADAPLGIHLHNHGYNSWQFLGIEVY